MKAAPVRLGHSLGEQRLPADSDALRHVLDIATGKVPLMPRNPADPASVERAERTLNAQPRPTYCYVGDLHPELGSVGLLLSQEWARRALQGASKCDSGGLAGGKGCFRHVPEADRNANLQALSSPWAFAPEDWTTPFEHELTSYTGGIRGYVNGDEPDTSDWSDARKMCIDMARECGDGLDRRLWTWELRMQEPPHPGDIEFLVISIDAQREIQRVFSVDGIDLPEHIRILPTEEYAGDPGGWFAAREVRRALAGE